MRKGDEQLFHELQGKIIAFDKIISLPGIKSKANLDCLTLQIIDSIRRIKYVRVIKDMDITDLYCDASKKSFDPIKAAVWNINRNNYDEAIWLVFLSTHFGKNKSSGWELVRNLYGGLGGSAMWTWEEIKDNFKKFQGWLTKNQNALKETGNFGNHRKYQSIDAHKPIGTGIAIGSYIEWIKDFGGYDGIINEIQDNQIDDPKIAFKYLYNSLDKIVSFGRTAKFDFLTMIGKLDLLNIAPDSTYMIGATGPKAGSKLLFEGDKKARLSVNDLNNQLNNLDLHLDLYFGMQVLEDSLCNWQKSPSKYIHFKG